MVGVEEEEEEGMRVFEEGRERERGGGRRGGGVRTGGALMAIYGDMPPFGTGPGGCPNAHYVARSRRQYVGEPVTPVVI